MQYTHSMFKGSHHSHSWGLPGTGSGNGNSAYSGCCSRLLARPALKDKVRECYGQDFQQLSRGNQARFVRVVRAFMRDSPLIPSLHRALHEATLFRANRYGVTLLQHLEYLAEMREVGEKEHRVALYAKRRSRM